MGSLNLNDIVWLRSYEGMNRFNLLELDKVSVFRDECLLSLPCLLVNILSLKVITNLVRMTRRRQAR